MDFQTVVDSIGAMTCVISVEKLNGGYGTIRIVTGNQAYLDSIKHPVAGISMLTQEFVPNSEYTRYLARDLNFEDFCYRAAVQKKCLHSYVHPERFDVWFNMTFLPLAPDDGNLCFCTYTMEISHESNAELMGNVSGELASAVLTTSLKLRGAKDFEVAMADVIRDIRVLCDAEYSCILLMDTKNQTCHVLCEDQAEDTDLRYTGVLDSADFYPIAESWEEAIAGSNCLIVKNERDMQILRERNSAWHDSLRETGAKTIALFPLKSVDTLLGYIWATNFDPEKAVRIKETLELTAFVLSSEISNHLLLKQLIRFGSRDMLTGVNNRNLLNERVAAISEGREGAGWSVGIVYADLNGLKVINDTEGHDAGDTLLRDAANALRRVFADTEIYRAGGDEFTMILPGASEEVLAAKTESLRAAAEDYPWVSFAIGYCAVSDGRDIGVALGTADQRMYEDKRRYYAMHPEKNRRSR